jgi:hypothetical protein
LRIRFRSPTRDAIIGGVEHPRLHFVSHALKIAEYHFQHRAFGKAENAFHVFGEKEFRLFRANNAYQLLVQLVAPVIYVALCVCDGEALAGETSDNDIAVGHFAFIDGGNVFANDMASQIDPIRFGGIVIYVVRPYHSVPRHFEAEIKPSGPAEKRYYFHSTSRSSLTSSSPRSFASRAGTAFPIWR